MLTMFLNNRLGSPSLMTAAKTRTCTTSNTPTRSVGISPKQSKDRKETLLGRYSFAGYCFDDTSKPSSCEFDGTWRANSKSQDLLQIPLSILREEPKGYKHRIRTHPLPAPISAILSPFSVWGIPGYKRYPKLQFQIQC